ncbi:ABC transporter ATP-binding protein [Ramlibacter sp. 2FC]|uniref:ABC transporter ATP-binding protein n=1 Tax=Ramlibacter sp. 2FC TaxID=2502188 RepID=UPI0010FA29AF|nr:ABC transporter ATP-binding protein [Ramlibacter sp. 2FC]
MSSTMKPETLLDVRRLRVEIPTRHGALTALDEVSFQIARGEILGFVGESGAGKSLTGMAVIGLLDAPAHVARGEIWFDGRRIDQFDAAAMRALRGRRIGAIFQDPLVSLNPLLTVGDQLVETMLTHLPLSRSQARERAVDWLRQVGIPSPAQRVDAYPHQFSGGMRQRIVIALALCAEPDLVVADEPTTALDVSVQAQVLELLRGLCRERGTSVLLVTHDMGVISENADRVAVMYAGRIAEIGPVDEVVNRPRHPYTQGLMGSIPPIDASPEWLRQIDGAMPRLAARPAGCAFHPRCASASARCRAELPTPAAQGAVQVACWHPQQPTVLEAA